MSSLLDKIKSAVNASLRGTRHYKTASESPTQDMPRTGALPDIMDAHPGQNVLPEVTEASLVEAPTLPSPALHADSSNRVTDRQHPDPATDDLEDQRIVDLLQDNDA